MDMTPLSNPTESSDQELVNSYAADAPADLVAQMTTTQIRRASDAAHLLEIRGYTEQAGVWLHVDRPSLRATA